MTNSQFLETYGEVLARPTTGVSSAELYNAYVGYMNNDFQAFEKLAGRDQLAITHLFSAIRDQGYRPQPISESDLQNFNPNRGRPESRRKEWENDDYSVYIDFLQMVARNWSRS